MLNGTLLISRLKMRIDKKFKCAKTGGNHDQRDNEGSKQNLRNSRNSLAYIYKWLSRNPLLRQLWPINCLTLIVPSVLGIFSFWRLYQSYFSPLLLATFEILDLYELVITLVEIVGLMSRTCTLLLIHQSSL